jgi:hypothetical protein
MNDSEPRPPVRRSPAARAGNEPTVLLPVVPKVEARAVIVYEPEPRRPWGLMVFTLVLVALTVGVVLGQAVAFQPGSGSLPAAQAGPLPSYQTPPAQVPSATVPTPAPPVTAPLGAQKSRQLEVAGAAALVQIRSADLGQVLYSVTALDGTAAPEVVDTKRGPRLKPAGPARTEILLNSTVKWTLKLTGTSADQLVDMRAGGLAALELPGGAEQTVLQLPRPARTVTLRLAGPVGNLRVQTAEGVPVRLRLAKGADTAAVDGKARRDVKAGTVLTGPGWSAAQGRYEIRTAAKLVSVAVDHVS